MKTDFYYLPVPQLVFTPAGFHWSKRAIWIYLHGGGSVYGSRQDIPKTIDRIVS